MFEVTIYIRLSYQTFMTDVTVDRYHLRSLKVKLARENLVVR